MARMDRQTDRQYENITLRICRQLSFAEFVVTGFKSNGTSKTNNQNPFECTLATNKIHSNGI